MPILTNEQGESPEISPSFAAAIVIYKGDIHLEFYELCHGASLVCHRTGLMMTAAVSGTSSCLSSGIHPYLEGREIRTDKRIDNRREERQNDEDMDSRVDGQIKAVAGRKDG